MKAARARRSVHVVPGSSERFLAKAAGLDADELILDLEDAVAPADKDAARTLVVTALPGLAAAGRTIGVRINAADSPYAYRDVIAIAEGAGESLDTIMLPKARGIADIAWLDLLLDQIELACGLPRRGIGIEAQIEDAGGLIACEAIAAASPRMEALHFGPGDFSAAIGIPTVTIGGAPPGYPGDHLNHVYLRIAVAARAAGIQAIDGPYADLGDQEGLHERARLVRALGYDGKWSIHPGQIATVNEVFTPAAEEVARAQALLDAYDAAPAGAAVFDGEMVDEASRKMAQRVVGAGRAAGRVPHRDSANR